MARRRKVVGGDPMQLVVRNSHVVMTQRDRRRLRCKVCGESERILGEENPPEEVRTHFDYIVRYNAAVEDFLLRHEHKEV
jgi:hypothetical protein